MKIVLVLMCKQLRIEGQTNSRLSRAHEDPKGKIPSFCTGYTNPIQYVNFATTNETGLRKKKTLTK